MIDVQSEKHVFNVEVLFSFFIKKNIKLGDPHRVVQIIIQRKNTCI